MSGRSADRAAKGAAVFSLAETYEAALANFFACALAARDLADARALIAAAMPAFLREERRLLATPATPWRGLWCGLSFFGLHLLENDAARGSFEAWQKRARAYDQGARELIDAADEVPAPFVTGSRPVGRPETP